MGSLCFNTWYTRLYHASRYGVAYLWRLIDFCGFLQVPRSTTCVFWSHIFSLGFLDVFWIFPRVLKGFRRFCWSPRLGRVGEAVICGIYHYCDQHRIGTELQGPVCSEATYRALACWHGAFWDCFVFLEFLWGLPESHLLTSWDSLFCLFAKFWVIFRQVLALQVLF